MHNIRYETEGPVAIVTIDRPAVRNAVDAPTAAALAAAFRRFEVDAALAVAVLTGAGGTFCAGADLKGVATARGNRVIEYIHRMWRRPVRLNTVDARGEPHELSA